MKKVHYKILVFLISIIPVCGFAQAPDQHIQNVTNKPLAALLDSVYKDDQHYRLQLDGIAEKYGWSSVQMKAQQQLISRHDSVNVEKVKGILDKYGWLGKEEVGDEGNKALFYVIQHAADMAIQLKYLPMLRDAVKSGKAKAFDLAMLEDRTALREGKEQIYGTQLTLVGEKFYIEPIIDPANVDKRRAEVGLRPMNEYLSHWGMKWSLEQYVKDREEFKKEHDKELMKLYYQNTKTTN